MPGKEVVVQPVTADVAALDLELTEFLEGVITESKEEVAANKREAEAEAEAAEAKAAAEAEAAEAKAAAEAAATAAVVAAESEGAGAEEKKVLAAGRGGGGAKDNKPAWALSVVEAAKAEAEEEAELLSFAENLDYDAYIAGCDDEDLQEAWRLMKEAEAAESSSGAGEEGAGGGDEAWQAKFVRAMNNLTAVDLRHQKAGGGGGPGSNASQVSVAESAAEKALDRLKVGAPRSHDLGQVSSTSRT